MEWYKLLLILVIVIVALIVCNRIFKAGGFSGRGGFFRKTGHGGMFSKMGLHGGEIDKIDYSSFGLDDPVKDADKKNMLNWAAIGNIPYNPTGKTYDGPRLKDLAENSTDPMAVEFLQQYKILENATTTDSLKQVETAFLWLINNYDELERILDTSPEPVFTPTQWSEDPEDLPPIEVNIEPGEIKITTPRRSIKSLNPSAETFVPRGVPPGVAPPGGVEKEPEPIVIPKYEDYSQLGWYAKRRYMKNALTGKFPYQGLPSTVSTSKGKKIQAWLQKLLEEGKMTPRQGEFLRNFETFWKYAPEEARFDLPTIEAAFRKIVELYPEMIRQYDAAHRGIIDYPEEIGQKLGAKRHYMINIMNGNNPFETKDGEITLNGNRQMNIFSWINSLPEQTRDMKIYHDNHEKFYTLYNTPREQRNPSDVREMELAIQAMVQVYPQLSDEYEDTHPRQADLTYPDNVNSPKDKLVYLQKVLKGGETYVDSEPYINYKMQNINLWVDGLPAPRSPVINAYANAWNMFNVAMGTKNAKFQKLKDAEKAFSIIHRLYPQVEVEFEEATNIEFDGIQYPADIDTSASADVSADVSRWGDFYEADIAKKEYLDNILYEFIVQDSENPESGEFKVENVYHWAKTMPKTSLDRNLFLSNWLDYAEEFQPIHYYEQKLWNIIEYLGRIFQDFLALEDKRPYIKHDVKAAKPDRGDVAGLEDSPNGVKYPVYANKNVNNRRRYLNSVIFQENEYEMEYDETFDKDTIFILDRWSSDMLRWKQTPVVNDELPGETVESINNRMREFHEGFTTFQEQLKKTKPKANDRTLTIKDIDKLEKAFLKIIHNYDVLLSALQEFESASIIEYPKLVLEKQPDVEKYRSLNDKRIYLTNIILGLDNVKYLHYEQFAENELRSVIWWIKDTAENLPDDVTPEMQELYKVYESFWAQIQSIKNTKTIDIFALEQAFMKILELYPSVKPQYQQHLTYLTSFPYPDEFAGSISSRKYYINTKVLSGLSPFNGNTYDYKKMRNLYNWIVKKVDDDKSTPEMKEYVENWELFDTYNQKSSGKGARIYIKEIEQGFKNITRLYSEIVDQKEDPDAIYWDEEEEEEGAGIAARAVNNPIRVARIITGKPGDDDQPSPQELKNIADDLEAKIREWEKEAKMSSPSVIDDLKGAARIRHLLLRYDMYVAHQRARGKSYHKIDIEKIMKTAVI